jgi:hypothetical protein
MNVEKIPENVLKTFIDFLKKNKDIPITEIISKVSDDTEFGSKLSEEISRVGSKELKTKDVNEDPSEISKLMEMIKILNNNQIVLAQEVERQRLELRELRAVPSKKKGFSEYMKTTSKSRMLMDASKKTIKFAGKSMLYLIKHPVFPFIASAYIGGSEDKNMMSTLVEVVYALSIILIAFKRLRGMASLNVSDWMVNFISLMVMLCIYQGTSRVDIFNKCYDLMKALLSKERIVALAYEYGYDIQGENFSEDMTSLITRYMINSLYHVVAATAKLSGKIISLDDWIQIVHGMAETASSVVKTIQTVNETVKTVISNPIDVTSYYLSSGYDYLVNGIRSFTPSIGYKFGEENLMTVSAILGLYYMYYYSPLHMKYIYQSDVLGEDIYVDKNIEEETEELFLKNIKQIELN